MSYTHVSSLFYEGSRETKPKRLYYFRQNIKSIKSVLCYKGTCHIDLILGDKDQNLR